MSKYLSSARDAPVLTLVVARAAWLVRRGLLILEGALGWVAWCLLGLLSGTGCAPEALPYEKAGRPDGALTWSR